MGQAGNIFLEDEMDFARFMPALSKWFEDEVETLNTSERFIPDKPALMMGLVVWGREYIDTLIDLCIPSLLSPANIEALSGRTRLVIHTDEQSFDYLVQRIKLVEQYGIELAIHIIPQPLIEMTPERPCNKYWLLGTCQHLHLKYARHAGMGYHMLMPDHLYSERYFPNLLRLADKHLSIVQSSLNTDKDKVAKVMALYRIGDAISIDSYMLNNVALMYMHEGIKPVIMNGRDILRDIPASSFLVFIGKDYFCTFSPHMSIAYLSPQALENLPMMLHNALDTHLPWQAPDFYVPQPEDDMSYLELSSPDKSFGTQTTDFTDYALRFWVVTHFYDEYLKVMMSKNKYPVKKSSDYMEESEIDAVMHRIVTLLKDTKDTIKRIHDEAQNEMAVH